MRLDLEAFMGADHPASQYCVDVLSGDIPACKYVKLAIERNFKDLKDGHKRGIYFDREAAQYRLDFYKFCRHSKGKWAGQVFEPEPWQQFIKACVYGWKRDDGTRRFRVVVEEIARKNGKALSLDTLVPTVTGWKTMGEMEVGDCVFGENGDPTKVTFVGDIQFDHKCYKITFSNGDHIIADAEHLWMTIARVNTPGERKKRTIRRFRMPKLEFNKNTKSWYAKLYGRSVHLGTSKNITEEEAKRKFDVLAGEDLRKKPFNADSHNRIRTTEEIFKTQRYGSRNDVNHSIKMPKPVELPEIKNKIDPYILGVWLGDGCHVSPMITCGDQDLDHFLNEFAKAGIKTRKVKRKTAWAVYFNSIGDEKTLTIFREMGLFRNKHIPKEYLRASKYQRISLLQGLMDTDGTVSKSGKVFQFVTIKKHLANEFGELLAGLGIKYSIIEKIMRCNGKVVDGTCFSVQFNTFVDHLEVFRLKRKLGRMRISDEVSCNPRSRTVQITSVEQIDSVPVRCIKVDSSTGMFLAGKTMIPTHNTSSLATDGLFLVGFDGEAGAEVFTAAVKRDQARLIHSESTRMVKSSPQLRSFLGTFKDSIFSEKTYSKYVPLGADSNTEDGLNVHGALIDEYHAHPTAGMYDVLRSGMGARSQPLLYIISTAGFDKNCPYYDQRQYAISVLEGTFQDDSLFAIIYTLDEKDDWTDESLWIKSNPNLDITVSRDDMRDMLREALESPTKANNFKTKKLNIWTEAVTRWISDEAWAKCAGSLDSDNLDGRICYGGLDLSSTIDLTAWVLCFPPESDDKYRFLFRFFLPQEDLKERCRRDKVPYDLWIERGLVMATPGATVDYNFVETQIRKDAERFDLREIAFDPYNATQIVNNLLEDEFEMVTFRQGYLTMSPAAKDFERRILKSDLVHNGNPVMKWMISCTEVASDPAGNIKPVKPDRGKSSKRIDGVVASIMALDRAVKGAENGKSVYCERGVLTF